MNIAELEKLGGLIPAQPIKTPITWKYINEDGVETTYTFDVFVKVLAYGDYEAMFLVPELEQSHEDGEVASKPPAKRSHQAQLIQVAIRLGEKAEEQFTYDQAFQLDPALAAALVKAINRVNGRVKKKVNSNRRVVARAGAERSRGTDDSGSESEPIAAGVSAVGGVLPPARDDEPVPET